MVLPLCVVAIIEKEYRSSAAAARVFSSLDHHAHDFPLVGKEGE